MFASGFSDYVYTVQSGDTLNKIADKFGTDWQTIAKDNQLDDPNLIQTGQELLLTGVTSPEEFIGPKQPTNIKALPVTKLSSPVLPSPKINTAPNYITIFGISLPKSLVYTLGGLAGIIILYMMISKSRTTA